MIVPWTRVQTLVFSSFIHVYTTRRMRSHILIWWCELCGSGNNVALTVHAPAPAGTTVDRSFTTHRAEDGTDLFLSLVDTARRMTALGRHTVIIICTILERGRGRCDRRSRGQRSWSRCQGTRIRRSTSAYQNKTCCEEKRHDKP
jgi:hypothetical protein